MLKKQVQTRLIRWGLSLVLIVGAVLGLPAIAQAQPHPEELAKAVQSIENLDALRSDLAAYLKDTSEPPTAETMKQVCKPVGMKAVQLSQENGWQVKQIASKYRNPNHAPSTPSERQALKEFERQPELMGFWQSETVGDQAGLRYYRRINVEESCLACHGSKASRPEFVQNNYPQDLAYNFKVGDLRGMYSVFMPDVTQQVVEQALSANS